MSPTEALSRWIEDVNRELAGERATVAELRSENARLRQELSRVEQDRDLQHAFGKDLQEQLDRERAKKAGTTATGWA